MKEKGQLVKRGTLDTEGDLELWDDGTSTPRSSAASDVDDGDDSKPKP